MEYVKVNGVEYPARIFGRAKDSDWDERSTKTIELRMAFAVADELFVDDIEWSIITEDTYEEDGQTIVNRQEFDNSDYSLAGPITDMRDGFLRVKMGKLTDLEEAYELLYGGVE